MGRELVLVVFRKQSSHFLVDWFKNGRLIFVTHADLISNRRQCQAIGTTMQCMSE